MQILFYSVEFTTLSSLCTIPIHIFQASAFTNVLQTSEHMHVNTANQYAFFLKNQDISMLSMLR
jgi:hypothetical protein